MHIKIEVGLDIPRTQFGYEAQSNADLDGDGTRSNVMYPSSQATVSLPLESHENCEHSKGSQFNHG